MDILGKIRPMAKINLNVFERLTPVLLVSVIALSFVIGILWEKVRNLEEGGVKVSGATAGAEKTAGDETDKPANGKLSEEQAKNVVGVVDKEHIQGSKDAKVTLLEFSDLECPFCKGFHPTLQKVKDEYKDQVAWVYMHFPLDNLHPKADKEAEAAECANELGGNDGFWRYIGKVFEVTPSNNGLDSGELPKIAGQVGIDESAFTSCLDSGKYKDKVESQYQSGLTAGVTGTPGNFIINQKGEVWVVPGAVAFETLKSIIDEATK